MNDTNERGTGSGMDITKTHLITQGIREGMLEVISAYELHIMFEYFADTISRGD